MKKIVIAGGGFAGLEVYRFLHKKLHGSPKFSFHLISRNNYFLFYPMLHEVATGSVEREHITHPIREIVRCCLETFTQAEITRIDVERREVVAGEQTIPYDHLFIALGSEPNFFNTPGAGEHCISFRGMRDAVAVRNHLIRHFELATREHNRECRRALLHTVIIGGGATGVELAGQIADLVNNEFRDLYREVDPAEMRITLVQGGSRLLHHFDETVSEKVFARLQLLGVRVILGQSVTACTDGCVRLDNGELLLAKLMIWTAGVQSAVQGIVDDKYLDASGLVCAEPTLQLVGHPEVFVIGDVLTIPSASTHAPPQLAQSAVREARHAADNFIRLLRHKHPRSFLYRHKGDLIPVGNWFAVARIGSFTFTGRIAWILRRVVFLVRTPGWTNRIKIAIDWLLGAFLPRDTSEL